MQCKGLEDAYNEVLEETWNGLSMNLPPVKGGRQTPSETATGLAYRRGFNIDNGSLYNQNAANGQQPYEQEEDGPIAPGVYNGPFDPVKMRAEVDRLKAENQSDNQFIIDVLEKLLGLMKK